MVMVLFQPNLVKYACYYILLRTIHGRLHAKLHAWDKPIMQNFDKKGRYQKLPMKRVIFSYPILTNFQ